jgi:tetratricopeptide (TPR) repeat protein
LAIVQVGCFLKETPTDISTYTQLFKENNGLSKGPKSGTLTNYRPQTTLETAFKLTYNHLQKTSPAVVELFKYLAYLNCGDIWLELIEDSSKRALIPYVLRSILPARSLELLRAIGLLRKFELVTYTGYTEHFSIHRVLQKWNMDILNKSINMEYLQWAVFCIGSKARERGMDRYWTASYQLLPHALHCIEFIKSGHLQISCFSDPFWLEALHGIARILMARQAEPILARNLLHYVISGIEANPDRVEPFNITPRNMPQLTRYEVSQRALGTLGNMYDDEGNVAEAAKVYLHLILTMQARHLEKTKEFRSTIINYIAVLKMQGGKPPAGIDHSQLCQVALETFEMGTRLRSAKGMMRLGKFSEAVTEFDKLRQENPLCNDNRDTIILWRDTAFAYKGIERWDIAEELLSEALPYSKIVFGNTGQMTISLHKHLGETYHELNKPEQARQHLEFAVEALQYSKGLGKAEWVHAAKSLGYVYISIGRVEEAKDLFLECIDEAEICGDGLDLLKEELMVYLKRVGDMSRTRF